LIRAPVGKKTGREHHAYGHRQIERRAGLFQIGRSQIDRDPRPWKDRIRVTQGTFNPIAGFLNGRIGQSNNHKSSESGRNIGFDVYRMRFESENRSSEYM
jgi:hypothetical protein